MWVKEYGILRCEAGKREKVDRAMAWAIEKEIADRVA